METTSGEEVFAFIAAAAAGTRNDDTQKEKGGTRNNRASHEETEESSRDTSHGTRSTQERTGTIDRTPAEHTQQLWTLVKRNLGQSVTS